MVGGWGEVTYPEFHLVGDIRAEVSGYSNFQVVVERYIDSVVRFVVSFYIVVLKVIGFGFFELSGWLEILCYRDEVVDISTG